MGQGLVAGNAQGVDNVESVILHTQGIQLGAQAGLALVGDGAQRVVDVLAPLGTLVQGRGSAQVGLAAQKDEKIGRAGRRRKLLQQAGVEGPQVSI